MSSTNVQVFNSDSWEWAEQKKANVGRRGPCWWKEGPGVSSGALSVGKPSEAHL